MSEDIYGGLPLTVPFLENILFFEGALFFPFFSRRLLFPFLNSFFSALYRPSPGAEVVYDDAGAAVGVKCGGETAKCKFVVGDPSYFLGKVTRFSSPSHSDCHQSVIPVSFVCLRPFSNPPPPSLFFLNSSASPPRFVERRLCPGARSQSRSVARVVRAICLLSHPIPGTNDSHSVQIILPQKQARECEGGEGGNGEREGSTRPLFNNPL